LGERGQNVDNMNKKAADLEAATQNFLAMAKKLREEKEGKAEAPKKKGGFFSKFK